MNSFTLNFFSQCFFSCQKRKSLSSRIQKIGNRQLTIICFNFWWFGSRLFLSYFFFSVQKSVSSSKVIKGFFLQKGLSQNYVFLNAHSLPLNCKIGKKGEYGFSVFFVLKKWKIFISIFRKSSLSIFTCKSQRLDDSFLATVFKRLVKNQNRENR